MHGAGIKRGITIARDAPVLLDITRLISRVGYGHPTGIDRVEVAYLDWCLSTAGPLFLIARLASGYAILDRDGAAEIQKRLKGVLDWGPQDLRATIGLKTPKQRGRAEADVRRLAIQKGPTSDLLQMTTRLELQGFFYLNVGHSNLTDQTMSGLKQAGLSNWIMLHDLIPRLHPQFQRQEMAARFDQKLRAIERYCDVIVTNSEATRRDCLTALDFNGPIHSLHLGTRAGFQKAKPTDRPYFIAIGTIEPRKNYGFLLDVWEALAQDDGPVPPLHIVGRRGWADENLLQRLDAMAPEPWFHEHNDLDDPALDALLSGARALVFPTLAEGFGLPSVEAASIGVPVICGDLVIHRELLGDYPVYASLNDIYAWKKAILDYAKAPIDQDHRRLEPPTWEAHFTTLEDLLSKHTRLKQGQ